MMSTALASDPTATLYSYSQCAGSLMPYPQVDSRVAIPDSLTPLMINHVGRHGARNPASPRQVTDLLDALQKAQQLGSITPLGSQMISVCRMVMERCHNYWGALDSLGMAEQRAIASRMFVAFPKLFTGRTIDALSSYSPRCVMSMYEFTHQLDRINNDVAIYTSSGRQNSPLMRPFDLSADFTQYIQSKVWETPYADFASSQITSAPLRRILGDAYQLDRAAIESLTMAEYYVVASMGAMGLDFDPSPYFTLEEYNRLWSVANLKLYLQRTANTLSTEPADIASDLVLDLITTTDEAVRGNAQAHVALRFGHAETLLPLLSLLKVDGAYYLTNYFDTVALHFRDFDLVPMAANLQMIVMTDNKGKPYVRFDLNERPITLIPGDSRLYLPWSEARAYMIRCLPLTAQP